MSDKSASEYLEFTGTNAFQLYANSCAELEYMYPCEDLFHADNASNDKFKTYVSGGTSE